MHTVTSFNPQIPPSSTSLAPLSSLDHPVSSVTIDRRYKGLRVAKDRRQTRKVQPRQIKRQVISIDVLPDDVLLATFGFYVAPEDFSIDQIEMWTTLVHVCQRWRNLVFGSPRHLNLRLVLVAGSQRREKLDNWPSLPLLVVGVSCVEEDISVLKLSDRVRHIRFPNLQKSLCEKLWEAMQVPFPDLKIVSLESNDRTLAVIPDSFLGGSAPQLQFIRLHGIPFPALPKLLSSTTCLVDLFLQNIPHSGYISPQAMVTGLSTLTRLEQLRLEFQSPRSHPDRDIRTLPPPKRTVLPALMNFRFKGVSEYLEDLLICIDIPKLKDLHINFFTQIDFDNPQLAQFIIRTPTFKAPDEARVLFHDTSVSIVLPCWTAGYGRTLIEISSKEPFQRLASMAQICNTSLPPLSRLENLYVEDHSSQLSEINDVENTQWLELLLPFTGVKNLYLSRHFTRGICRALEELVGDRISEILPALQEIFVPISITRWQVRTDMEEFIAARQSSGNHITVSHW